MPIQPFVLPKMGYVPDSINANDSNPLSNVTSSQFKWGLAIYDPKLSLNPMINETAFSNSSKMKIDDLTEPLQNVLLGFKIFFFVLLGSMALVYGFVTLTAIWHVFHEHVILFFTEKYEWIKDEEEAKLKSKLLKHGPYEEIEMQPLKRKRNRNRNRKLYNKHHRTSLSQRSGQNTEVKLLLDQQPEKRNRITFREIEAEFEKQQQRDEKELEVLQKMIAKMNANTESESKTEYRNETDSDLEYIPGITQINKRPAKNSFEVLVDVHAEPVAGPSQKPFDSGTRWQSASKSTVDTSTVYLDKVSLKQQDQNPINETEMSLLGKFEESNDFIIEITSKMKKEDEETNV